MQQLTQAQSKYIISLQGKKFRDEFKAFIIEGEKMMTEAINSKQGFEMIVVSKEFATHPHFANALNFARENAIPLYEVEAREMVNISQMVTPPGILAVLKIKEHSHDTLSNRVLFLDAISDPGNLGTLIRSAEWFGFSQVFLSRNSVEIYNPKAIAASMGSIFRIQVFQDVDIVAMIKSLSTMDYTVITTTLEGKDVLPKITEKVALVVGSESHGVSDEVIRVSDNLYKIPGKGGAESLNAAVAGSVVMSQIYLA